MILRQPSYSGVPAKMLSCKLAHVQSVQVNVFVVSAVHLQLKSCFWGFYSC